MALALLAVVASVGSPVSADGVAAFGAVVSTGAPTDVTHNGAVLNGTVQHTGCCNISMFAVSASPSFDGPVYDYSTPYVPGQTLIIRMQRGSLGESYAGPVSFDARSWTPDGTPMLLPETTYYVRFGVQVGTDDPDCLWSMACHIWGEARTFTTRAAIPAVAVTAGASGVDDAAATLSADVTAGDAAASVTFEYSTSASFSLLESTSQVMIPAGGSAVAVSKRITGLAPSTTYFYRVVAAGPYGTARGEVRSFRTTAAVGISLNSGASITSSRFVTVTVSAPAGATGVILSNDGGFSDAVAFPVGGAPVWSFEDLGPVVLSRTVYARFTGPGVDASRVYSDDIIYDARSVGTTASSTRSLSATSVARLARLSTARSARVRLSVAPSSVGRCRVQGVTVRSVRSGPCKVTVTVIPVRGRAISRTVTIQLG